MINTPHNKNYALRWQGMQRRIGITGGIASGKSSVESYLKEHRDWPVLDADKYAKMELAFHTVTAKKILQRYGNSILLNSSNEKDQAIDRLKLGEIIFSRKKERIWLENQIHPNVIKKINRQLKILENRNTLVMIVPLLFEINLNHLCSEIWIVDCEIDQQYERLMARNSLTRNQAKKRINCQIPLIEKTKLGDIIIDNRKGINELNHQIKKLI